MEKPKILCLTIIYIKKCRGPEVMNLEVAAPLCAGPPIFCPGGHVRDM